MLYYIYVRVRQNDMYKESVYAIMDPWGSRVNDQTNHPAPPLLVSGEHFIVYFEFKCSMWCSMH